MLEGGSSGAGAEGHVMENLLPPSIPEAGGAESICLRWRGLCPSLLSLTQVLDTLWLVGNRGAADARLSWCRLFAPSLLRPLTLEAQGEAAQLRMKRRAGQCGPFRSDGFGHGCQQDGDLL